MNHIDSSPSLEPMCRSSSFAGPLSEKIITPTMAHSDTTSKLKRIKKNKSKIRGMIQSSSAAIFFASCCIVLNSSNIDAFSPPPSSGKSVCQVSSHHHKTHNLKKPPNTREHSIISTSSKSLTSSTSLHVAAAARATKAATAWLFTPDRTANILADTVSSSANVAIDAALDVAGTAAAVTTETITHTIYKAPFLSLAISFFLGGLFFSTVAAFVAAFFAFGRENSRRLKEVMEIVLRRNWSVVKLSLMVTRDVLLGKEKLSGFKNRFPAALQTLKDGFVEVRRVFTESVDAIKKETQMYSAAVGLPGLIPIQYIFDRITPLTLTAPFENALEDALSQTARDNAQIRKLNLKKFSMGEAAPRILEARLFDLGKRDMAFDLEILWKSDARADLEMRFTSLTANIPVTIQNLRFEGPVRLIVIGLMTKEPGYEALLISLPRPPQIGFDLKVAGGLITQIPWLRNELAKMLDDAVAKEVLWPRRAVVSAPSPSKPKPLLNPMQMLSLMRDDPLLRRERELMASIPDEFRSNYEAASQEDIPDFDIRQVNGNGGGTKGDIHDDDKLGGGGLRKQWKFWRTKSPAAVASQVETLELMAQSLQQESQVEYSRPVIVAKGVDERKGWLQKLLSNLLIPRSLVSYANREGW